MVGPYATCSEDHLLKRLVSKVRMHVSRTVEAGDKALVENPNRRIFSGSMIDVLWALLVGRSTEGLGRCLTMPKGSMAGPCRYIQ